MTAETIANPSESAASQSAGIETLLTGAAFAPLDNMGFLRVTGEDRVRWLNGMATNSIHALRPGQGCYNFFLNAQGRIQGDATAWMLEESILLETADAGRLATMLDHFIIMDDVELTVLQADPSIGRRGLLIVGSSSYEAVAQFGIRFEASEDLHLTQTTFEDFPVDVFQANSPLVPRLELWSTPAGIEAITVALKLASVPEASRDTLNQLRILEGTPLYGTDIRDKELPQETAQTRALHFAKGCYLGQEIVERIRSRGNVHRTFSGFMLSGSTPAPGTPLFAESIDKPVGEITSAAAISLKEGCVTLALGYIRREVLDSGIELQYEGGTAIPTTLPFKP